MNDYSFLIDQMVWSFSRLQLFQKCPYGFYVHYILGEDEDDTFLASFGSFIHKIHQLVLTGELAREDAQAYFLANFRSEVPEPPPSKEVFSSYYRGAFNYLASIPQFDGEIVGVEKEFFFDVGGYPFHGFADLITRTDAGLMVVDHKSRNLKPFSNRKKPTKTDQELTEYFRQLYLYALAVKQEFGEYPAVLAFNCYRERMLITQEFNENAMDEAVDWATGMIREIRSCRNWNPDIDFFKCRNLCGLNDRCDYKDLM